MCGWGLGLQEEKREVTGIKRSAAGAVSAWVHEGWRVPDVCLETGAELHTLVFPVVYAAVESAVPQRCPYPGNIPSWRTSGLCWPPLALFPMGGKALALLRLPDQTWASEDRGPVFRLL